MDSSKIKDKIVEILDSKNGGDISSIDLDGKSGIADYFVIATGKNPTHARALADAIEEKLEELSINLIRSEGKNDARWIVLDYSYVIVHIFNAETRDFYCLEALWKER